MKKVYLIASLCVSGITSASQASPLSSYNSFLKQLFSRQYSQPAPLSAPRHETPGIAIASQDTSTSKIPKIIGSIFVLGATGALAFACWKHATKKRTTNQIGYDDPVLTEELRIIFESTNDAAYPKNSKKMAQLIRDGANPEIIRSGGLTLLGLAVLHNDPVLTLCCLKHRSDPNAISCRPLDLTPLMEARSVKVAKQLLNFNADPKVITDCGETILHAATTHNRPPEVIALFCSLGVDPNQQDSSGNSALHYASLGSGEKNHIMAALLYEGADLNITNNNGETPAEIGKKSPEQRLKILNFAQEIQQLGENQKDLFKQTLQQYVSGDLVPIVIGYFGKQRAAWNPAFLGPIQAQLLAPKPIQQKPKRKTIKRPYA